MPNFNHEIPIRAMCAVPTSAAYLEFKSFEYFRDTLNRLFRNLYNGYIGGEFVEVMRNLILGQIVDAYVRVWSEQGGDGDPPAYLNQSAETMVKEQQSFVEPLYKDIVDARVNETSFEPFKIRAEMWAARYKEAEQNAVQLITQETGGKLIWIYDPTKEHCTTCEQLHLVVAFASEWERSGLKPQHAPNDMLECGGWQCGCTLTATDKRRSPNAMDKLLTIGLGNG